MNKPSTFLLGVASLLLTACSQPAAMVSLKGDQFYGRDGGSGMAIHQPDYNPPAPTLAAPIHEMEVADLTPPSSSTMMESRESDLPASLPPVAAIQPQPQPLEPLPIEALSSAKAPAPLGSIAARNSNFIWPVEGPIVSRFGPKQNGLVNDGINISAREGEPIWAAAKGEVVYAGNELKGYGNMLILRHENDWMSAYAHTSDMLVKKGDKVSQGDLIGYVGKTGAVSSAQLHFGIREGKTPIDPETLLPRRLASAK